MGYQSVNNIIVMVSDHWSLCPGGSEAYGMYLDIIWMFDEVTEEWEEAGRMKEARDSHAVSTVPISDVIKYCQ